MILELFSHGQGRTAYIHKYMTVEIQFLMVHTKITILVNQLTLNMLYLGFPGGSVGKEFACNAGDPVQPLGHSFLEKEIATHSVFLPREFYGQRNLAGYSPWGHKDSNVTERLHFHFQECNSWVISVCQYLV